MKAITIYQPHASLVAVIAKIYETRSWATKYRGQIAIHAGAKRAVPGLNGKHFAEAVNKALGFTPYEYADPAQPEWFTAYYAGTGDLPHGAIIATAELVECWRIDSTHPITGDLIFVNGKGEQKSVVQEAAGELLFGDFSRGRYAWELRNVTALLEPLPFRGFQRIWNVPDDVIETAKKRGERS